MRSHRALQSFSSPLTSGLRWHMLGCPFASHTTVSLSSIGIRHASTPSSARWLERQSNDYAKKVAILEGLKSRAALKLIGINKEFNIFKPDQTVVDLGYAPGSWSQVAVDLIAPSGRVLGVDIIPALPPKGASTIQGDFTSPLIQAEMKKFLSNPERGRPRKSVILKDGEATQQEVKEASQGYIERERVVAQEEEQRGKAKDVEAGKDSVDVVLSDMWDPWIMIGGLWKQSLSKPYRLMNVSGIRFRDHACSMDLCTAALLFCIDVLKPGGTFICKFYQGEEDTLLERKVAGVFEKVSRHKPDASRLESRENYIIAQKKKKYVEKEAIVAMAP